jgi:conserved oligomeric Golgi complex subunit 2
MSIQATNSKDPFQLERLAEELESRESLNSIDRQADLPIFTPLSHENPYLTAPTFNVEEFLISRLQTSTLQDLRTELRDYQSSLKEELVKLINDDYEAFISLSTDLRGEGARLERLKFPLKSIKEQISVSDK